MDSKLESKPEFTYMVFENFDFTGADIWNSDNNVSTWDKFVETAKSMLKPGQAMVWVSQNNQLVLKTIAGTSPKAISGLHTIVYGRSL